MTGWCVMMINPDQIQNQADLAEQLRQLRKRTGLSYDDLARKAGVAPATVHGMITGTTFPRQASLLAVVKACGEAGNVEAWRNAWCRADEARPRQARPSAQDLQAQVDEALDRAGQIDVSDKIGLALERLGSDQPAIRVGAVQALADIATTVAGQRARIAQILSTHLRSEAPGPGPDADNTYLLPALRVRLPVAQAIVTVLTSGQFSDLDLSHADLCGADLANRDLRGADLRKVNLRCADLAMADLRGADLREANLTGAKAAGALLAEAKVTDARLTEMDLTEVDLSEVVLVRVDMSRSKLAGVDFSRRRDLYYSNFQHADLTGANLSGAELRGAQFPSAKLHNADLSHAGMVKANLKNAWLDGTRMRYADLAKADLTHAWLKNTDLRDATLHEADLTGSHLSGTDLRGASLLDANLSHITDMRDVRIDRHTQEEGDLSYRSPSEVRMEEDAPYDDQ
jgi:uncharacterized protein YjbI with pentapeptide repeats/transcriptional regulator with XRE-family HTH domain